MPGSYALEAVVKYGPQAPAEGSRVKISIQCTYMQHLIKRSRALIELSKVGMMEICEGNEGTVLTGDPLFLFSLTPIRYSVGTHTQNRYGEAPSGRG